MSSDSSRFAKTAKKTVRRGVSLYKVGASPYWYARIWNRSTAKYIVRSTKETSRIVAAEVAEELYSDLKQKKFLDDVPKAKTFIFFAEKLINQQRRLAGKTRSVAFASDDEKLLKRKNNGIIDYFYKRDIALVRTSDITEYFNVLDDNRDKALQHRVKPQQRVWKGTEELPSCVSTAFAVETTSQTKKQILPQASTAMRTQINAAGYFCFQVSMKENLISFGPQRNLSEHCYAMP